MSSFLTQTYRRRATPLHSARAGASAAFTYTAKSMSFSVLSAVPFARLPEWRAFTKP